MNIIAAVNSDWGIGYNGTQSVVIPEDRRHFMTVTNGGIIITGRKTYEEFGKPLPNRKNIILTRNPGYKADGAVIKHSIGGVLKEISGTPPEKVFIIGGEEIYRLFLPMCGLAYITKLETAPQSDTFFPNLDEMPEWEIARQWQVNEHIFNTVPPCAIRYSFVLYRNNSVFLPQTTQR